MRFSSEIILQKYFFFELTPIIFLFSSLFLFFLNNIPPIFTYMS